MPLVPMRQVLEEAEKGKYGVGAYNVNNMEQLQGIIWAAEETKSPVILQVSKTALKYTDKELLVAMVRVMADKYRDIPIALHLDHGANLEIVKEVIDLGFTSVMIDGSLEEDGKTPRSFEDNVRVTKEVVDYAHPFGVTVEGELGTLGGIEDGIAASRVILTDPDEAKRFVEETGVDALAVAIGTSHGAYKFKATPKLALDIADKIHQDLPHIFLVLHGSSSVPQDLVEEINAYGGRVAKAMGVPIEMIQEAIGLGVRKINIDTDGRLAFTGAIRKYFHEHPEAFDQRKYLGEGREAIRKWVKSKMLDFGTAGHAHDYQPLTLEDMKKFYSTSSRP
ncbi:ketose-bisphosphate aldolase [candidate division NPL-UPA2 bacterium]|nr:ketose-bisphosphate aldolase [candidate division NPL-UPA2 bacterium]